MVAYTLPGVKWLEVETVGGCPRVPPSARIAAIMRAVLLVLLLAGGCAPAIPAVPATAGYIPASISTPASARIEAAPPGAPKELADYLGWWVGVREDNGVTLVLAVEAVTAPPHEAVVVLAHNNRDIPEPRWGRFRLDYRDGRLEASDPGSTSVSPFALTLVRQPDGSLFLTVEEHRRLTRVRMVRAANPPR